MIDFLHVRLRKLYSMQFLIFFFCLIIFELRVNVNGGMTYEIVVTISKISALIRGSLMVVIHKPDFSFISNRYKLINIFIV
jgi:hypothetical protein